MELDFQSIFRELNELKINYLIVGGLAVNFHGVPRMTYDIDLMILPESRNISKLVTKLTNWGYRLKIPINPQELADEAKRKSWIQEKGMMAAMKYCLSKKLASFSIYRFLIMN